MDIQALLEKSSHDHSHLCPRQILGVRIGLAGMSAIDFEVSPSNKRLLVITETDGCFVDGLTAATNCTVGHRTLRVEDYGKVAATFIDAITSRAIRVSPRLDVRQRATMHAPDEPRHYFAQMQAYQTMPDDELVIIKDVNLIIPIERLISRPGVRTVCDVCGEEIINEREVYRDSLTYCRACANGGYYHTESDALLSLNTQRNAVICR